jgi:hypothetical protein
MRQLIVLILSLVGLSGVSSAENFIPPMPDNLADTRFSLLTVGVGDAIHARFGHSMIRIEDYQHQLDYVVNWGLFDFSDPLFIPKFFRGILIYRMGFSGTQSTIAYYKDVEKRSVSQDEISLTSKQKRQLLEKIIWNAQPQNISYPYQYFRNNCATIPRDFLDLVTKGYLRKSFESAVVPLTYRDYIWNNIGSHPIFGWGLDVIFNRDTDQKLSKWQEMFYPLKLREYLSRLQGVDDGGEADSSRMFLSNHRVLADVPEPTGDGVDGYRLAWGVAGIPLIILLLALVVGRRMGGSLSIFPWCFRLFGVVSLWWGLTCGFFGLTHFSGWAFSDHTDLYGNFNMLLFWPMDMLVLIPGVQMGVMRKRWDHSGHLKVGFWRKYAFLHIGFAALFILMYISGTVKQDVSRVALYLLPLSLLYYAVMIVISSPKFIHESSPGGLNS